MAEDGAAKLTNHGICSLLSSAGGDRDFLVRHNGDKVQIDDLKGKKLGLYFSASWSGPCQHFTRSLVEAYTSRKGDFEVVFVSADDDDESFNGYFSKMPWLAIPFFDSDIRDKLEELFKVEDIPYLLILDGNGEVLTVNGVEIIRDYGAEGYPFTPERVKELKEQQEAARREQTLGSLLVSHSRDFVITNHGMKVRILGMVKQSFIYSKSSNSLLLVRGSGKSSVLMSIAFPYIRMIMPIYVLDIYEKLKAKKENFEIVLISFDDDEESFKQDFGSMPWLSLPFKDRSCEKLARYFDLSTLPTLLVIGPDGKTLHPNVAEAIEDYGIQAYPFTPWRFQELEEMQKARQEAQTLESLLVSGKLDFVIDKSRAKVLVSGLVGKNILLYFSAHWCPPCRAFLPKLIEAYHKIKANDKAFEVIFISSDMDQAAFDEFFATMPWLALPFGDQRKQSLVRLFKVHGIPKLIAISPTGKTVTTEARDLMAIHGPEAYPFTDARLKEIEAGYKEMAEGWPEKLKHVLHPEHELLLTRRMIYRCDGCEEDGHVWSFSCEECNFLLHPHCAIEEQTETRETTLCSAL